MEKGNKAIVIGAGPSGMMAAGQAAAKGKRVILIDKNSSPGKKLGITGKGRCNVTNYCDNDDFISSVVSNGSFLYSAINAFSCYDTYSFFEEMGVPLKIERGNRVFPKSDKAGDIVEALKRYCLNNSCEFIKGEAASVITERGKATGVELSDGTQICATSVVIASGGKSYPQTGSDGSGYKLAQKCGHDVVRPTPSLVPLTSKDPCCKRLQGLSLRNVSINLTDHSGKSLYKDFGEMLFTHFGVSGPMILSASSHIEDINEAGLTLTIDLKPALNEEKLNSRVLRDLKYFANKDFANSLHKLLPNKIIPVIVKRTDISPETKCHSITREQRQRLVKLIKGFSVSIDGFRPIQEAIITRGGVDVRRIDPKTMQSKLIKGLFFAGEVMDTDAYTGGFNLQIAFSTGYVAGNSLD